MKLQLNELHFLPAAILPYSDIKELQLNTILEASEQQGKLWC